MARVPVVVENEQRLRPVTDARANAEDFTVVGRAVGAGLQRLGGALGETAQAVDQIDATYDEARAKQLDNEYQEFERGLLFGDDGFYKKQNADAINARQPTAQAIDDQIATLTSRAQNGRERQMITGVLQRRRQEALNGLARYSQTQAINFAKTQSSARIQNATDNYARYVDDPDRGPAELATIRSEVSAQAALLGLQDAGVIKAMQDDALSKAHSGVVQAKAVNDPVAAMQYLEKHRDQIDEATQLGLDRQLHPALVERDAEGIADMALGLATPGEVQPDVDGKPVILAPPTGKRSSNFGYRTDPITGQKKFHSGWDIPGAVGAPAGAAGDGVVAFAGQRGGYGNMVIVRHPDGTETRYGHLSRIDVKQGDPVKRGDAVGGIGSTGRSTGPHLHFEVVRNGRAVDPGSASGQSVGNSAGSPTASSPGDLGAQLAWVDRYAAEKGLSDDVRRASRAEVERRYALNSRIIRERQDQEKDAALESVMSLGDNFTSPSQIPNFSRLDPSTRLQFSNWAKTNVDRARAEREAAAKPRTDIGKWSVLSDAYAADPKAFLAIRPEQVRPFLDDGDFNTYLGWRRDVLQDTRNGGTGKTPQWTTEQDIMGVSKTLLSAAGLRLGDSKDAGKDAPRVRQFTVTMLDWSRSFKAQNGRLPNSEEIRRQADRYLIEGTWQTPGKLWGSNTNEGFAFEAPNAQLNVAVPKDIRQRILTAAPDATDAEIARIYVRGKGVKW